MKPKRAAAVVVTDLPEDEVVVATPDQREALVLNATGAAVLELCDGSRSVDDIVDFICSTLGGADESRVRADVEPLLRRLRAAGIVYDACGPQPTER